MPLHAHICLGWLTFRVICEHLVCCCAGLVLNCLVAGLYMASYMMMIPTAAEVLAASPVAFNLFKRDLSPLLHEMFEGHFEAHVMRHA